MEQIELILGDCECKTSKNDKKYSLYDTDIGKIACWDTKVIEKLDVNLGNKVLVEISEANGFKTIVNLMRVIEVNALQKQNATEISIHSIEEAWTKKNPSTLYHKCNTDKGIMFVWNETIAAEIKEKGINKLCLVKIEEKNNFKTITNFLEAKGEAKEEEKPQTDTCKLDQSNDKNDKDMASYLLSYSKDLVVPLIESNPGANVSEMLLAASEAVVKTYKKIKEQL